MTLAAHWGGRRYWLVVALVGLSVWTAAEGSTVQPMTVAALADNAGQVIVGTVADVRSYWADNPRRIESQVTLRGVEYLKGRLPDATDTFTLTVPGGRVGEMQLTVCCAPEFRVGEKWILFLLPTYKTFPVVGLFQGAFLVERVADGVERVAYRRHGQVERISGVDGSGFIQCPAHGQRDPHVNLIEAGNMRLLPSEPEAGAAPQAMSYDEFVQALRPVLAASRDHHLTQPAGQRIPVQYRAVPLRPSRLQESLNQSAEKQPAAPPRGTGGAREATTSPRTAPTARQGGFAVKTLLYKLSLCTTLVCILALNGDRAGGFSYYSYSGYSVIWDGGECVRYLAAPSTFPEGSDTDVLILASMGQWSSVWSGGFQYYYSRLSEDPEIDNYDGYCDTAAVPAEWLDPGVLGVTYMVSYYDVWYDMDLLFADYPANTGWHMLANPDCEVTANPMPDNGFSFYLVALHELGHCIGLGHDPIGDEPPGSTWLIGTMNPRYPAGGPVGNENIIELHSDDREGTRFLYPGTPQTKVDVANAGYCSQGTSLGKATPVFAQPNPVTPGQPLTIWSSIENFGTANVSNVRMGFYLSTDATVTTADLLLGYLMWNLPVNAGYEFGAATNLPDLVAGSYTLGTILDDLNHVAEEYEDNNRVVFCDPLVIAQAVPAFGAFSQQIITCEAAFSGPTPVLTYPINMAPVTWTIDNPQPGMTIEANTGVIHWLSPIKSPFLYEIVLRATNSAGSSTQTLELGVHQAGPQVVPIPNHSTPCGADYVGPTPVLTAPDCMAPILGWSLVAGPAGMTINSSSGVVSWLGASPESQPYLVTIRAINAVGETTESWLLFVASANGDLDADGAVDLIDANLFAPCLAGPSLPTLTGCDCADFDLDGDVDLVDFERLMLAFSGSTVREGACCFSDANCGLLTPMECYTLGGTYRGDGTTCASVECTGACCFYTAGCLVFSEDYCNIAGGTYQGMGTHCNELTCPSAGKGACCLPNHTCSLTTEASCASAGGTFRGVGMSCQVVDCSTPTGACCHHDGTCSVGTAAECAATAGTYIGDHVPCVATTCLGACCYPDGGCLDLNIADCGASGGTFEGPQTDCATFHCPVLPTGACCYFDNNCSVEIESRCTDLGGSYQGDGTTCVVTNCTARGACCLATGTCKSATQAACAWAGGTYIGQGVTCASVDCSTGEQGACYDPTDWTCTVRPAGICAALGGTYEGAGTTCTNTLAPEYRNDIVSPSAYYAPGANKAIADDLTLGGTARGLTYYDLAVAGSSGGSYNVSAALYTACPGEGGTLISGTQGTWSAVPADDYIYVLSMSFAAPVRLPSSVWMVVTFSSANAGWVVADQAERGSTADQFGQNDPPWTCDYWFGGPPNDCAGFWADIQCVAIPEAQGACCHTNLSCTQGTQSACESAGGFFMGANTLCAGVNCSTLNLGACCDLANWTCSLKTAGECAAAGGNFDGVRTSCTNACPEYKNEIDPITLSYNPGEPMADDITLAGTARDLAYFEIAVYGGGGGTFSVAAASYDKSPCSGGAQMPGTLINGSNLPDGQVLSLVVTLPTPVTLPNNPWLVVEFSNAYAGWIVAGQAETGATQNYFGLATYSGGQWIWTCNNSVQDPPNNPHAGFWADIQCIDAGKGFRGGDPGAPIVTVVPLNVPTGSIGLVNPLTDARKDGTPMYGLMATQPLPLGAAAGIRSLANTPPLKRVEAIRRR